MQGMLLPQRFIDAEEGHAGKAIRLTRNDIPTRRGQTIDSLWHQSGIITQNLGSIG
jgi:hypothetical protein